MANTYRFSAPDNSAAQRSGDGKLIAWALTGPLDVNDNAQWVADGSPTPSPYAAVTPIPARTLVLLGDIDRQNLVAQLADATPAQIKNYVQNNVTDLASAKLLLAKILLLVSATINS